MALVNVAPPGQKSNKPSTLENAASVMGILGNLGGMYKSFQKPKTDDELLSALAAMFAGKK